MHRTFVTSTARTPRYLDGLWDFCPDPQDQGVNDGWYSDLPTPQCQMWVPGVWNTTREYLNYEGVAWFRTTFQLPACMAAAIHFGAVTHQANIWLDGEPLGEHYGGFLPFSFLLSQPTAGEHTLVVRVDNSHDMATTIPSANLDWCRYGGIFRPVWVEALTGPGYVASLRLLSVVEGNNARLTVRAELMNISERALSETYTLFVNDKPVKSGNLPLDPGEAQPLLLQVALSDVRLWSPKDPYLYRVRLAFAGDDLIERTGLRTIGVQGSQLLLNGAPMRLWGLNRHEDHPDWGFALPAHLLLRDLALAHDLGATALRGSHYPNDPRFLDLCDERGLLFMEEIPLWGYGRQHLAQDIIGSRASAMLWAMIARDMHHPSIMAWSILNECATDTHEGRTVVSDLVELAHEMDPTRPVTYASNKGVDDICFDLVDIVCLNAYYGWYRHDLTWNEFLDRVRAQIGDKPIIVSEFGAGGIYGCHALEEDVLWSEEYQRKLLEQCVELFLQRPDVAGFFVWQFFDTRTDGGERALRRPRSYNNKGLLDEYRRPKLAYHALKELLYRVSQRLLDRPLR